MKIIILILNLIIYNACYSQWFEALLESSPLDTGNLGKQEMMFCGIDCPDSNTCYAIANDQYTYRVVYLSEDTGKNWRFIYTPDFLSIDSLGKSHAGPRLRAISAPTNNRCVIACDSGVILLTTDKGISWEKILTPLDQDTQEPLFLVSVKMLDSNYGVACSYERLIYTQNGGRDWKLLNTPVLPGKENACIKVLEILTPSKIIYYDWGIVGYQAIMITTDTGNTWKNIDPTNINKDGNFYGGYKGGKIEKMFFIDSLNGWIAGGDPTGYYDVSSEKIASTIDGGLSWQIQYNEVFFPYSELWDISFHDKLNGIAVSRAGGILRTNNGGLNWIQESVAEIQKNSPSMVYVCFRNVERPIIALFDGRIYYNQNISTIIEKNFELNEIKISPNPVIDFLQINSEKEIDKIEIFSTLGLKVLETEWKEKIDVSGLSPGIYFVKIGNAMNKFIKL